MGLIKRKTKRSNGKDSIIVSLTTSINDLKEYLADLENGKAYNIERFNKGSVNYANLEKIIKREKSSVRLTIESLESTLAVIKTGIFADVHLKDESNSQVDEI